MSLPPSDAEETPTAQDVEEVAAPLVVEEDTTARCVEEHSRGVTLSAVAAKGTRDYVALSATGDCTTIVLTAPKTIQFSNIGMKIRKDEIWG